MTIVLLSICLISFSACNKDEKNLAAATANVTFHPTSTDVLIAQGPVIGSPGVTASGVIKVYKNPLRQVLRFEDFSIKNTPNVRIYLSKAIDNIDEYINIGDLVAASGNFNYTFGTTINVAEYQYVIVYADDNNSILATADL